MPLAVYPTRISGSPPAGSSRPQLPGDKGSKEMTTALLPELEAELARIRKDPTESVGSGEKGCVSYVPNSAPGPIGDTDPKVTERLVAEARKPGDRVFRLAVTHVIGNRADATVDSALIALVADPELRATATAAYELGRAGYKGYPRRTRDPHAAKATLEPYLDDPSVFDDPFYRHSFRTQGVVLGTYVRIVGPERFHLANSIVSDLIGLRLPGITDVERADLLAQACAMG
jgi:hypothetical protein